MPVSRIWITGSSGAGKTTMASEIDRRLQLPRLELDGLFHGPDWTPADPGVFRSAVLEVVAGPRWVVDGNYNGALGRTVADRAELRIAIDLSVPVTMSRVIRRTVRRAVTREELWNGNRGSLRNFTRWDPLENIIRWTWDNRHSYHEKALGAEKAWRAGGLPCVRLASPAQVRRFVDYLTPNT
ncbi:MAG: toxin [Actinomycetota bacterium]|nr:toxin [Actinomycetota bacterium]